MSTTNSTTAAADTTTATQHPVQTQYPVVEFEYPDSDTGKMKLRYLKVVSADADYVKGYELDTPGSKKDGQFKSFLRNRLARNGVSLVSF